VAADAPISKAKPVRKALCICYLYHVLQDDYDRCNINETGV
jgi:hypothetical protein